MPCRKSIKLFHTPSAVRTPFFAFPASPATKVSQHRVKRQGLVTCPGYAGYCSASYPGDTCLVVCAFGRNNVPECQVCCRAESHDLTNKEYVE